MASDSLFAANLAPYEALLAECVSSSVSGKPITSLACDVDWPKFVTAAVRHGVAQPAAALISSLPDLPVPPDVRSVLQRVLNANRVRNLVIYGQVERLLQRLGEAGIEALVLKGVALSVSAYTDFGLRNFADVDILVRDTDVERAHKTALSAGWTLQDGERELGHHHAVYERFVDRDILTDTVAPEFDAELTAERLKPHARRIRLEIHRSPFFDVSGAAVRADLSSFWNGAQTYNFPDGIGFRAPGPDVMLVHLCAHAASHGYHKAQFALDIAHLLSRCSRDVDAARVSALARQWRVEAQVRTMLRFIHMELRVCHARRILDALPSGEETPLTWRKTFDTLASGRSEIRLKQWMGTGGAREKLVGAIRMVFPTPAAMRRIYGVYHPALLLALYVWRPFQLSGRLLRILIRRAPGSSGSPRKEIPCHGSKPS